MNIIHNTCYVNQNTLLVVGTYLFIIIFLNLISKKGNFLINETETKRTNGQFEDSHERRNQTCLEDGEIVKKEI